MDEKVEKQMKEKDIRKIHAEMKKMPHAKFMMATEAYHILGNISSDKPDIVVVGYETDEFYIGRWITGFGFINVVYPKSTTRELSEEEKKEYYNKVFVNPDGSRFQLDTK